MTKELDVRLETLNYTARYAQPAFNLWAQGGTITEALYKALSPYGATLQSFQATPTLPNASVPLLTIGINSGALKFAYDRLEFTFSDFTTEFFESLPQLFFASTNWLRESNPKFQFGSHEFNYYVHSYIKGSTTEEILATANPKSFESTAGLSLGHGAIFHHAIPDRKWQTQLIVDRSNYLPDGLFLGLNLIVRYDDVKYDKFLLEGREYFGLLLQELGLNLPDFTR